MNWADKTNQEINAAVAKVKWPGCEVKFGTGETVAIIIDGVLSRLVYNPCQNANDAWPIILAEKISIEFRGHKSLKPLAKRFFRNQGYVADDNPLRAAMCVYLEMSGVEV